MGLYSHYDGAHNHPVNRALHLIAIPVGFSSIIVVWFHWIIALLLIPPLSLARLGHLIEKQTCIPHQSCARIRRPNVDGEETLWKARRDSDVTNRSAWLFWAHVRLWCNY